MSDKRGSRNNRQGNERTRDSSSSPSGSHFNHGFETRFKATAIVDEILMRTPESDKRYGLLLLLRHQLEVDEKQLEEARRVIEQFQEVYEKLTSPANRIGTFLGSPEEGIAHIAVGDAEYYANIDPNLDAPSLKVGTRVKINDAFAVIGDLGYATDGPIAKVSELLPDGRLRVSLDGHGLSAKIVRRSSDLSECEIKVGDEVRLEPSLRVAVELFQRVEVRDYFLEKVSETPWSKIGGQDEAIRLIRELIEVPLLYPELYRKFGKQRVKGILLYGPPGCGKTLIGKATAYNVTKAYREKVGNDVREYFMLINGPQILSMWVGETERAIREIFATARERSREGYLVFIFVDEADAILRTRSSGKWLDMANTVVPQFAAEMDGLVDTENVVVMLTSNRPDYIDPAILRPGRIDRKLKIARPNRDASREILAIYLNESVPIHSSLIAEHGSHEAARQFLIDRTIDFLFRRNSETAFVDIYLRNGRRQTLYWCDLISGALIMSLVERAKDFALRRAIENGDEGEGVTLNDLCEAAFLEYRESEIFPKSENLEDWLKLIDYEPENVVEVRPIWRRERDINISPVV
ncbi:MAG: AAA family ATPase [Armatimonadota bacterium]|nr:AAA family ATPase [Armatimonadota bacterium]MCX7776903.1 AAA family ATPase [Armatimonadota bacterium]MDW8024411.1 AAA family ATPase [Armatimonadota bacterium]